MPRPSLLIVSAFALTACLGIFACAQDASELGADGTGTIQPDGGDLADTGGGSTADHTSTPPPPPPPPPQDSGTPPEQDSAPPDDAAVQDAGPPPDAAPLPNGDCDTSNSFIAGIYFFEYGAAVAKGSLTLCSGIFGACKSATDCCYKGALPACISR